MEKYHHLGFDERDLISQLLSQGKSLRDISASLGRNVSNVSRQVVIFPPVKIGLIHGCSLLC